MNNVIESLLQFWEFTGFANCTWQHIVMIVIGITFIYLGIAKKWEPMLLVPIGFGMLVGNIPLFFDAQGVGLRVGVYEEGSVLNILYSGVKQGWYPPLIFLGIGAMTDFSALISQPRLILIGAAAQMGIFGAYLMALYLGFLPNEAGAIGIIGGADGPTAIFLSSKLAPDLMGAIAVCAYSYMALVPVIQKPIMKLLTTEEERKICEINSGMYIFNSKELKEGLSGLTTDNAQGEYYLPDVIVAVKNKGLKVGAFSLDDPEEIFGINTVDQLEQAKKILEKR